MRIAVCDDDPRDLNQLVHLIKRYNEDIQPDRYGSAEALLSAYSAGCCHDIIFMDIQLGGMSGFSAAQRLKQSSPRSIPLIVFATVSRSYTETGYAVARGYLTKPFSENDVLSTLSRLWVELGPKFIRLVHGAETHMIHIDEIMYAEVSNNDLTITKKNGKSIDHRMPMEKFCSLLPKDQFIQPHRSFVVAQEFVTGWDEEDVWMADGRNIRLSRSKRKNFIDGMTEFQRRLR